jgi:hypothetical protein
VVVLVGQLDLQLPVLSVLITTKVTSSYPAHGGLYPIQHYLIKLVSDLRTDRWFSLGTKASPTNKTDRHDLTELLLKVGLNPITLTVTLII